MRGLLQYYLGPDARKCPPLRYDADLRRMSASLVETYVESARDADTDQWLAQAACPSLLRSALAECIRPWCSRTTANGLAGRGGMFVMSTAQWRSFLTPPVPNGSAATAERGLSDGKLLDVGAGDGGVTSTLAPLFRSVTATEDAAVMRWRLRRRGYEVLPAGEEGFPSQAFRVVSCLNVLDRADAPLSLLRALREAVEPRGFVVLAVVLPWCPFVEDGAGQRRPKEALPMAGGECCRGATFEQSLEKLVANVLVPAGFEVLRWTKVPYLCEGSTTHRYYKLDDAVMLLRVDHKGGVVTGGEPR